MPITVVEADHGLISKQHMRRVLNRVDNDRASKSRDQLHPNSRHGKQTLSPQDTEKGMISF